MGVNSSHLISYWSPLRRPFHARPRWVHSLGIFDTRWAPGPLVRLMQLADGLRVRSRVYRLGSLKRDVRWVRVWSSILLCLSSSSHQVLSEFFIGLFRGSLRFSCGLL